MSDQTINSTVRKKHRHEGPRNHVLAFALSIILTALAFLAVSYTLAEGTHVQHWFVQMFIVSLAIFQAIIQLAFWMHMKDKGHGWPIVFIIMGVVVAFTAIASALFWVWY